MESLVSIIVPFYNTEKFLPQCIESILNQTHTCFELILVNDGSTDASKNVAQHYADNDSRITVLEQKNAGQAVARNKALDVSNGEYIMFVDSDDYIRPEMLSVMLSYASQGNADFVFCAASFDNGFRVTIGDMLYQDKQTFSNRELLKDYFTTHNIQSAPWGKLYHKSLFADIRFPAYRAREDYAIMHRILGNCKTGIYCARAMYVQNIRVGSTEYSRFSPKKLAVIDCDLDIQQYIREYFPDLYVYVARNYADSLRNCIRDIAESFCIIKYKKQYNDLVKKLEIEVQHLRDGEYTVNLESHEMIINHSAVFLMRSYLKGIRKMFVKTVKKYLKFRR